SNDDLLISTSSPRQVLAIEAATGNVSVYFSVAPAVTQIAINSSGKSVLYGTQGSVSYIIDVDLEQLSEVIVVGGDVQGGVSMATSLAHEMPLCQPQGMAWNASDGSLWIAETCNMRVMRVAPSGNVTATFTNVDSEHIDGPAAVAISADGSTLWVADSANSVVLESVNGGALQVIAGIPGLSSNNGDAGVATAISLNAPCGLAVNTSNGYLYIADTYNHRVRVLNPDGTISKLAGGATPGFSGDGSAAVSAALNMPLAVAVHPRVAKVWIADTGNNVVRLVHPNGTITTVAGIGNSMAYYDGDGMLGTATHFSGPSGVAYDVANDTLWIVDAGNNRLRVLLSNGYTQLIMGSGSTGSDGDGGLASRGRFGGPRGIALDANASRVWVSDFSNGNVRMLYALAGPVSASPSASPSRGPSDPACAALASPTPSASSSASASVTQSASGSSTPSAIPSMTSSSTPAITNSATTSVYPSVSPTKTSSVTPTSTASVSSTATGSGTVSSTTTVTGTPTPTGTATTTTSGTASASVTPTPTATTSVSGTASVSGTPTSSPSTSTTASPSSSLSPSGSVSASASPTASALQPSPSRTQTPSSSPDIVRVDVAHRGWSGNVKYVVSV
ncbi:MAG: hypothetical protein EOO65_01945, partial [Methanosarcinales archaeon]